MRRRAAWLILLVRPLACSGGGGESGPSACFTEFDASRPAFSFQAEVAPGDVRAFTSSGSPNVPVAVPVSTIRSGPLTVSQAP